MLIVGVFPMRRLIPVLALLALLSLFALGCGEKFDYEEDPTLEEIMSIGRGYLRRGDGGSAAEAFEAALKISPTCDEAKFGVMIARNVQFFSLIDELLTLISGMSAQQAGSGLPVGDNQISFAETEPIGDYIQGFLRDSAEWWYEDSEQLYVELLTYPDPHFDIDHFEMSINGLIEMKFGGRLDRSDLQYFGVINALMRALVNFILAHDINYDFFSMQIPELSINLDDLSSPEGIQNLIDSLEPIVQLLEDLLTYEDNPDFLYLKGEEGVARMQAAGIQFGQAFQRLHLLFQEIYRETSAQTDGTVYYIDTDGDGIGDPLSESVVLPGFGEVDAGLANGLSVLGAMTSQAIWDATPFDIDPYHINPFYPAYANDLLVALDVFPLVLDQATLQDLLESLGLNISVGEDFQIVIPEIPDGFLAIDIGPWFAQPQPDGVRQLLWFVVDLYNTLATYLPDLLEG